MGRFNNARTRPKEHRDDPLIDRLHRWKIGSLDEALRLMRRPIFTRLAPSEIMTIQCIADGTRRPPPARMREIVARSDELIDEAIAKNPALAKNHRWVRDEDGMFADAALVALGDDRPCFNRRRGALADQAYDRALRVVISTDSNTAASIEMAAAVCAVVRLVQQWRPVEVWWQGAWLTPDKSSGFVFHVPLVQGDMDFSKIEYILADETRDTFSYRLMATEARSIHRLWKGCGGEGNYSYLEGTDYYVNHMGIPAAHVEYYAAWWLGLPTSFDVVADQEGNARGALQEIKVPTPETPETEEERKARAKRLKEYEAKEKAQREAKAASRLAQVN